MGCETTYEIQKKIEEDRAQLENPFREETEMSGICFKKYFPLSQ